MLGFLITTKVFLILASLHLEKKAWHIESIDNAILSHWGKKKCMFWKGSSIIFIVSELFYYDRETYLWYNFSHFKLSHSCLPHFCDKFHVIIIVSQITLSLLSQPIPLSSYLVRYEGKTFSQAASCSLLGTVSYSSTSIFCNRYC